MKEFNLEKALAGEPVVTRNGKPVKIAGYNQHALSLYQVIGWIDGVAESWCENGKVYEHGLTDGHDLFMAPIERKEYIVRHDKYGTGPCLFGPFKFIEAANQFAEKEGGTIHEITIHE